MDYSDFVVPNTPETILYIPNFITSEEEQHILASVDAAPKPKWTQLSHRRLLNYGGIPHKNGMIAEEIPSWLKIYMNKINNLGVFDLHLANHVLVNEYLSGQGIMGHTDGPLFHPTISTISCGSHTILEFTKIPTNTHFDYSEIITKKEYDKNKLSVEGLDGDGGRCQNVNDDGESKSNNKTTKPSYKLLVEPRSLLILKGEMYHNYMHQISEISEDVIDETVVNLKNCENLYKIGDKIKRNRRISLTIRHVPKTSRMKINIGIK